MTDWADEAAKRCRFDVAVVCADPVSIAAALRKARSDALEEAAKEADKWPVEGPSIARFIRALKEVQPRQSQQNRYRMRR